jgi:glycosyltransferase involved in cell wall biosynthesis
MRESSILIFGFFPYPGNSASTARTHNLGQGLVNNGKKVLFVPLLPSDSFTTQNKFKKTNFLSLNSVGSKKRKSQKSNSKLFFWLSIYWAALKAQFVILWLLVSGQIDTLIVYGSNFSLIASAMIFCRIFKVPVVLDVVEQRVHNSRWEQPKFPLGIDLYFGEAILPKLATGVIIIAKKLNEIAAIKAKDPLLIPAIESWEGELPKLSVQRREGKLINLFYLGALLPRDDPESLFAIVLELCSNKYLVNLDVFGNYENNKFGREWKIYCQNNKELNDAVNFMGYFQIDNIESHKEAFHSASAFILTRRNVEMEQFSFPTRLVEFLRYGKPVIASSVGDIPDYLTNEDAILIPPHDPVGAANSIIRSYSDHKRWRLIGRNGQIKGKKVFNRNTHARNLVEYISTIR